MDTVPWKIGQGLWLLYRTTKGMIIQGKYSGDYGFLRRWVKQMKGMSLARIGFVGHTGSG